MTPIYQIRHDDCLIACIATLMELPYTCIPNFNREEKFYENGIIDDDKFNIWLKRMNQDFLRLYNLELNYIEFDEEDENHYPPGYAIRADRAKKEDDSEGVLHAVVVFNDQIIHDPVRIKREYIKGNAYWLFRCLDPSLNVKKSFVTI